MIKFPRHRVGVSSNMTNLAEKQASKQKHNRTSGAKGGGGGGVDLPYTPLHTRLIVALGCDGDQM